MGIRWTEFQGETMFWDKVMWCFAVMIIFYIKIIFYISKNIFLKKLKIKKNQVFKKHEQNISQRQRRLYLFSNYFLFFDIFNNLSVIIISFCNELQDMMIFDKSLSISNDSVFDH